ncbi:MAG TPA: methyltransferase, partial [Gemmatimonadaceae bacterium]|nr:methyltransferase [Gemmatimonadaceae bacterium]
MREYKPFPSELRGDVAAVAEHGWTVEPFVEGAPEDYRRLRELLAWANYTEAGFRARFEIDSLAEYKQRRAREAELPITTPLELLARLFLDGDPVEREAARALLGDDGVAALERLALLHAPAAEPHTVRATLLLYPTFGLWIASDAGSDPNGEDLPPPRDVVYPAITLGTQRFVQLMPHEPCGDFVELCSGTGIAALVAARDFATHAWAVDLTERSTRFARFNAALNAIENFTALEGDLYEPLGDRTFDRIVAHPPYVPSFETQYVFRDGGEDGEQITRGIVSRLDRYLRPGGTCFISCMVSDRVGAPAERRMRETLGAVAGEFDVVVAQEHLFDPAAYYARQAQYGEVDWGAVGRRLEAFKQLGIEKLVLCGMQFRRRALEDRSTPVLTERRMLGPRTSPAD